MTEETFIAFKRICKRYENLTEEDLNNALDEAANQIELKKEI